MKAKITKRIVDALQAGEVVNDIEVKGFQAKGLKNGVSYYVRYRDGVDRRAPIRTVTIGQHGSPWTPDEARKRAIMIIGKVEDGANPAAVRAALRAAPTVEELAKRFRDEHAVAKRKKRTSDEYGRLLDKHVIPEIGKMKVQSVTRPDIAKLHHKLADTPYQANRVLAVCSKMFSLAEAWGLRPDGSNPCRHIEKFRETPRERILTAEELGALGKAMSDEEARLEKHDRLMKDASRLLDQRAATTDPRIRTDAAKAAKRLKEEARALRPLALPQAITLIRLMLLTGARLGEILTLKWEYFSADKSIAYLPDSKTDAKPLRFPPPAVEVLDSTVRINGNPYVIVGDTPGSHLVNPNNSWTMIRKAAGLDTLRQHDLRHGFASVGAGLGLGLPIIGKLLGHKNHATTQRYAHVASDPATQAAAVISEQIAKAVSRRQRQNA
jgi:integrase